MKQSVDAKAFLQLSGPNGDEKWFYDECICCKWRKKQNEMKILTLQYMH